MVHLRESTFIKMTPLQSSPRILVALIEAGLLIVSTVAQGCITTKSLNPESFERNQDKDVYLTTTDGKDIMFAAGDYTIITIDSVRVIKGKGLCKSAGQAEERSFFEGAVPIGQIQTLETREKTPLYYTGVLGIAIVVGSYFVLHGNIKQ